MVLLQPETIRSKHAQRITNNEFRDVLHPNTVRRTLYNVQCTLYTAVQFVVHCICNTVRRTLYTIHCTMYTGQCTLYNCTQYIVYSIQGINSIVYILYCTNSNLYTTISCLKTRLSQQLYTVQFTGYTIY